MGLHKVTWGYTGLYRVTEGYTGLLEAIYTGLNGATQDYMWPYRVT